MLYNFRFLIVWDDSTVSHYYYKFRYFFQCFEWLQELFPEMDHAVSITVLEVQKYGDNVRFFLFASAIRVNGHIMYFHALPL